MANSRFEGRQRGWNDEDRGYASDRFREERDEGDRGREDSRHSHRYGGRDDRDRYRFDARFQDRGQDDFGALGSGYDRWGEDRGSQRGRSGMGSSGGYGPESRQDRFRGDEWRSGQYGSSYGSGEQWSGAGRRDYEGFDRGGSYGDDGGRTWGDGPRFGGEQRSQGYGGAWSGSHDRYRDTGGGRGFMDRAADEVRSWMGDEDASRRREADHRGKGPRGYQRSDERIRDEVNDRLSDDWRVDASDIEVSISNGEITLTGEVASKMEKRRAEDCADSVSGVRHVQNNLRVRESGGRWGNQSGSTGMGGTGTGGSGGFGTGGTSATGQSASAGQSASGTTSGAGASGESGSVSGSLAGGTSGTGPRGTQA